MGARNSKKAKISKYSLDTCYTQSRKLIKEAVIDIADYQYPRFNRHGKYPDGFYTENIEFLWGGIRMYKYTKRRCSTEARILYYLPKIKQIFYSIPNKYTQKKRRLSERQAF